MKFLRLLSIAAIVVVLTMLTQVGGIVYLGVYFVFKKHLVKRWISFILSYLLFTFLIIPWLAPLFGRERIATNENIKVHYFMTALCNRNYVNPDLNSVLHHTSLELNKRYPTAQIRCLDANFPFWDGFPLLPHLSHNDGKKLDIALFYNRKGEGFTNDKPSRSGYGIFESPTVGEYDQISHCVQKGYWQYSISKYLTFGQPNPELQFAPKPTRLVLSSLLQHQDVSKVFIEPHLRTRLGISHAKLRFHGCRAVRHDDHIHLQIK
ncbi:MAG: hypothetical protein ABNH00_02645 [Dokdonia sp.]|jgi:hypothetical protein